MSNKSNYKIQSIEKAYKEVLEMKKSLNKILNKLQATGLTDGSDITESVLMLSEKVDTIISIYNKL